MEWPMCRHVERQARRMHDMMERLDVDPGKLARLNGGAAYAEARMNCLKCVNARECLLWLEARSSGLDVPDFCPNVALFEACKRAFADTPAADLPAAKEASETAA